MKKRTPKEWQRLVAEYELGQESRREFCERYGLATSTLDYWRRRGRSDTGGGLVEVEIESKRLTGPSTLRLLSQLGWEA